jgi:hypothetical protein
VPGSCYRVCTANGTIVCLLSHGNGVIELAGLHIDNIVVTGEAAMSEGGILSVVDSWGSLVHSYFLNNGYDRTSGGLGHAFRKTLCADTVSTGSDAKGLSNRRLDDDDNRFNSYMVSSRN